MKKVVISKVDMDTALTAYIIGVKREDEIIVVRERAKQEWLSSEKFICIECGGSGKVEFNNFDHHDEGKDLPAACQQAYERYAQKDDEKLKKLVEYVSIVDTNPKSLPPAQFPTLSSVFSGMLLTVKSKEQQLFKGMDVFKEVIKNGIDPFLTMPELKVWKKYIEAKRKAETELKKAILRAKFFLSKKNLKIGYIETDLPGALGALYEMGADVAIAYSPNFGSPPIRKFTIAGNNINVFHLVDIFNKSEAGWGGRDTIIGSPRKGTRLSVKHVINIVRENT